MAEYMHALIFVAGLIICAAYTSRKPETGVIKTLIISVLSTSPNLFLFPLIGWSSIAILILEALILTGITRYLIKVNRVNS